MVRDVLLTSTWNDFISGFESEVIPVIQRAYAEEYGSNLDIGRVPHSKSSWTKSVSYEFCSGFRDEPLEFDLSVHATNYSLENLRNIDGAAFGRTQDLLDGLNVEDPEIRLIELYRDVRKVPSTEENIDRWHTFNHVVGEVFNPDEKVSMPAGPYPSVEEVYIYSKP